ncbi:MAG TPA: YciI family protein [Methylomirabilota bacterium]|nr:YciI family protein [Methylomirabilota bacterium]
MKYTILVYESTADFTARTDGARRDAYWGAYRAYTKALADAGVMVGGAGLQPPPLATTVRLRDGKRQVQDGPFADTKEQLGGYYVIEVPGLDQALDWAARCPSASSGSVEVRPNLSM